MSTPTTGAQRRWGARHLALGLVALAATAGAVGALRLQVSRGYEPLLPHTDSTAAEYERIRETFRNDEAAIVVVEHPQLFSRPVLGVLQHLIRTLERLPGVDEVVALGTRNYIAGTADQVDVRPFLPADLDAVDPQALQREGIAYPLFRRRLLSADGHATALFVVATLDADTVALTEAVNATVESHRPDIEASGGRLFQSGSLDLRNELSKITARSIVREIPLVMLVMGIAAGLLTRSVGVGVLAAATGTLAVVCTLGIAGAIGMAINPVTSLVPLLLIPLGAAFCVHAAGYVTRGGSLLLDWIPRAAIRPFIFATVTTMIGFGANMVSDIPALEEFGFLGAVGVLLCGLITMGLDFPLLVRRAPRIATAATPAAPPPGIASRRAVGLLVVAATLFSIVGLLRVRVDYSPIGYFADTSGVRERFDRVEQLFAGTMLFFLTDIDGDEVHHDALDPERLARMAALEDRLEQEFPGLEVTSAADVLETMHAAFAADQDAPGRLPDSRDLAAQYLFLYGDTRAMVDGEESELNATIQAPIRSASEFRRLEAIVRSFDGGGGHYVVTGRAAQFFRASKEIARGQIFSIILGVVLVTIAFVITLRSLRLGVIAMIPNVLPVAATLSLLGWLGLDLDIGSAIAGALALGIAVDDTAHFLGCYTTRRAEGLAPEMAARETLRELQGPIAATTLCVTAGFLVLFTSDFAPFRTFALLLCSAMFAAIVGDLYVLPRLVVELDRT